MTPFLGWLGLILIAGCIFGTGYYIGRFHEFRSRRR